MFFHKCNKNSPAVPLSQSIVEKIYLIYPLSYSLNPPTIEVENTAIKMGLLVVQAKLTSRSSWKTPLLRNNLTLMMLKLIRDDDWFTFST